MGEANTLKHGLSLEDAKLIFGGALVTWVDERHDLGN
jgi:uncharacterized DUF497 family protein